MNLLFINPKNLFSLSLQMLLEIKSPTTTVTLVDSLKAAEDVLKQTQFDLGLAQLATSPPPQLKRLAPKLLWLVLTDNTLKTSEKNIIYFPLTASPAPLIKYLNDLTQQLPSRQNNLTKREKQIMTLVMTGSTHQGIATELGISPRTVNSHLQHIYKKINVTSKAQAITVCLQKQLLD